MRRDKDAESCKHIELTVHAQCDGGRAARVVSVDGWHIRRRALKWRRHRVPGARRTSRTRFGRALDGDSHPPTVNAVAPRRRARNGAGLLPGLR